MTYKLKNFELGAFQWVAWYIQLSENKSGSFSTIDYNIYVGTPCSVYVTTLS